MKRNIELIITDNNNKNLVVLNIYRNSNSDKSLGTRVHIGSIYIIKGYNNVMYISTTNAFLHYLQPDIYEEESQNLVYSQLKEYFKGKQVVFDFHSNYITKLDKLLEHLGNPKLIVDSPYKSTNGSPMYTKIAKFE